MNNNKRPFEYLFTMAGAMLVAIIGAAAGGTIYISISGAIVGALVALAILALLAIILSALGLLGKPESDDARPAAAAKDGPVSTASTAAVKSTLPPDAPIAEQKVEATESEAHLLAAGRFAEYHLAKAKRLQQSGHLKEAAHQAAASLAHGHLAEAQALREQIRQAAG